MAEPSTVKSPTLDEEKERLRKWREVRRQASTDPNALRVKQADEDRLRRLDQFEADKADRIRTAETRRREEAEAIESRRMEKARAHLEALDDIATARDNLRKARMKSRRITAFFAALFIAPPTVVTAIITAFILPPSYQSASTFAVIGTSPFETSNSLFNALPSGSNNMATAFQLRAQLGVIMEHTFEMQIDTTQGLVFLNATAASPDLAYLQNKRILEAANDIAALKVLVPSSQPQKPQGRVLTNTLLTFLVGLSIFSITAIFFQSFRHYART